MQCVRVWFHKNLRAKYISHLDLMRSMTRAVKRSGIKVWYTEGYNPHPYITFPLPLPLGVESDRECMDIKVEDDVKLEEIKKSFEGKMPEGLDVFDVTLALHDAKQIRSASYEIKMKFDLSVHAENYLKEAKNAIDKKILVGHKKGKQGRKKVIKQIELSDYILDFSGSVENEMVCIAVRLSAGNDNNINPNVFLNALNDKTQILPEYFLIKKTGLYTEGIQEFL